MHSMPNGGRFALKQFALWTISGCLSFGGFFLPFWLFLRWNFEIFFEIFSSFFFGLKLQIIKNKQE